MSVVPQDAPRSEDGQWWWDGSQWQAVEDGAASASTTDAGDGITDNGDGTFSSVNPDGSTTVSSQDGSAMTYGTDGGITHTDAGGTTTHTDPDGGVTGWADDGSYTYTAADGTQTQGGVDGSYTTSDASGTVTYTDAGGNTTSRSTDGTTTITDTSGTTTTTDTSGATTTTDASGATTLRRCVRRDLRQLGGGAMSGNPSDPGPCAAPPARRPQDATEPAPSRGARAAPRQATGTEPSCCAGAGAAGGSSAATTQDTDLDDERLAAGIFEFELQILSFWFMALTSFDKVLTSSTQQRTSPHFAEAVFDMFEEKVLGELAKETKADLVIDAFKAIIQEGERAKAAMTSVSLRDFYTSHVQAIASAESELTQEKELFVQTVKNRSEKLIRDDPDEYGMFRMGLLDHYQEADARLKTATQEQLFSALSTEWINQYQDAEIMIKIWEDDLSVFGVEVAAPDGEQIADELQKVRHQLLAYEGPAPVRLLRARRQRMAVRACGGRRRESPRQPSGGHRAGRQLPQGLRAPLKLGRPGTVLLLACGALIDLLAPAALGTLSAPGN